MTQISYHIRTKRNAAVFAYDNLPRAKQEKAKAEKRLGISLKIVCVTQMEEEMADV
jgi:hypothetical protein